MSELTCTKCERNLSILNPKVRYYCFIMMDFTGRAYESVLSVRVLIVDCDHTCLSIVSKMFAACGYEVATTKRAIDALCILRERGNEFNFILTEIHLPDMNKYELLEKIAEISKLPVVVLTADNSQIATLGSLFKGAVLYLVKPVTISDVKSLWQCLSVKQFKANEDISSFDEKPVEATPFECPVCQAWSTTADKSIQKAKRKDLQEIDNYSEEISCGLTMMKKQKPCWTDELHKRFLQVVSILGVDSAHPNEILQYLNVPGLTEESISSHLQEYRLSLKLELECLPEHVMDELLDSQVGHFPSMEPEYLEFGSHFPAAPPPSTTQIPFHAELIGNDMSIFGFELLPQSDQLHTFLHTFPGQIDSFSQTTILDLGEILREIDAFNNEKNAVTEGASNGVMTQETTQQQPPQQLEQQEPKVVLPLWRPLPTQGQQKVVDFTESELDELFDGVNAFSPLFKENIKNLRSISSAGEAVYNKGGSAF